jgi:hypothetical protein
MDEEKGLDKSLSLINFAFSIICRELLVGPGVREVFESQSDVLGSLNDAWLEFIGGKEVGE